MTAAATNLVTELRRFGADDAALRLFTTDGPDLLPYATLLTARDSGNEDLAAVEIGPHVVDRAGEKDPFVVCGEALERRSRIASDHEEAGPWMAREDVGKDVANEVMDALDVRHPVHRAEKSDESGFGAAGRWGMEKDRIDPGGDVSEDVFEPIFPAEVGGILGRDGDDATALRG